MVWSSGNILSWLLLIVFLHCVYAFGFGKIAILGAGEYYFSWFPLPSVVLKGVQWLCVAWLGILGFSYVLPLGFSDKMCF